jgi:hypothetical protein
MGLNLVNFFLYVLGCFDMYRYFYLLTIKPTGCYYFCLILCLFNRNYSKTLDAIYFFLTFLLIQRTLVELCYAYVFVFPNVLPVFNYEIIFQFTNLFFLVLVHVLAC